MKRILKTVEMKNRKYLSLFRVFERIEKRDEERGMNRIRERSEHVKYKERCIKLGCYYRI